MKGRLLLLIYVATIGIAANSASPSAQPSPHKAQACTKASDCKGALPRFCKICSGSDGIGRCAHWTCANSACAIETCPGEQ
jgi:hypothetical protein